MTTDKLSAALKLATFERIEDIETWYGEIPGARGVWATGKTLQECRSNLREVLEDWMSVSPSPEEGVLGGPGEGTGG
jgi:predicted RNase H-like HicB family nuclease